MENVLETGSIAIYESSQEGLRVEAKFVDETIWLNPSQMGELFGKDRRTVSEHVQNVFEEKELDRLATCRKFRQVQNEGGRHISREVDHYNLDVIISVGYRVKSPEGTRFRQWANKVLKEYLTKGYVVNRDRLHELGWSEMDKALRLMRASIPAKLTGDEAEGMLDIIQEYARTWFLLKEYDEHSIATPDALKPEAKPLEFGEAITMIYQLKKELLAKGQATDIFGMPREGMLEAILGNLYQTFDGVDLYPTVEEKASHLLYFTIKDHPFIDGNKRIGTYLFLVYLDANDYLVGEDGTAKFTDSSLVALALLVAESKPESKEELLDLIMHFVRSVQN